MSRKTWVEMSNGSRLPEIAFVAWIGMGEQGTDLRFEFTAPNPPIHEGDANLFSRLSYDTIKRRFESWGFAVDYIIRGESSETGVRDCYVYKQGSKVPFAVVRPAIFAKDFRDTQQATR